MLAELLVCYPGFAFFICLEGECIDEDGFSLVELNIVCAGVFEGKSFCISPFLDFQCGQGSIFNCEKDHS